MQRKVLWSWMAQLNSQCLLTLASYQASRRLTNDWLSDLCILNVG